MADIPEPAEPGMTEAEHEQWKQERGGDAYRETAPDLARLRELLAKARLPWAVEDVEVYLETWRHFIADADGRWVVAELPMDGRADLIEAAVNAVPWLLDHIETLQARLNLRTDERDLSEEALRRAVQDGCPHVHISDEGTAHCTLAEGRAKALATLIETVRDETAGLIDASTVTGMLQRLREAADQVEQGSGDR